MGKILSIVGDTGFFYTSIGWITFSANEFDSIVKIKKEDGRLGMNWYLATPVWNLSQYDYLGLPHNSPSGFFQSTQSFENHFNQSALDFEKRELEVWKEVTARFNAHPQLLAQTWLNYSEDMNHYFNEIVQLLSISAINDQRFIPKIKRVNNSDDYLFEFYAGSNTKIGGFWNAVGDLMGENKRKPKFSFRLSELNKIITSDGQSFQVKTKYGIYYFPWLFKLNCKGPSWATNEKDWERSE